MDIGTIYTCDYIKREERSKMKIKKSILIILLLSGLMSLYAEEPIEHRISITDNLNLREGPGLNYKIIKFKNGGKIENLQLKITDSVKVLKISETEDVINGKKGRWVYIDPGYSDKTCGWVFDYYLAKKEDFRPLVSLPENMELIFDDGDVVIHYKFFKNGTTQYINDKKIKSGKLYIEKSEKVIVIKWDDQKEFYVWNDAFIYKSGRLCVWSIEPGGTCSEVVK